MTDFGGKAAIITGASGLLASGVIPVFRAGGARLALSCGDDRLYQRFPDLRDDCNHICLQNADLSEDAAAAGLVAQTSGSLRPRRCAGQYCGRLGCRHVRCMK